MLEIRLVYRIDSRRWLYATFNDCIGRASQRLKSDTPIQAFYVRHSIHPRNMKEPSNMDEKS
jgi:hypothetical protein